MFNKTFKLGNRVIGDENPTFIIAEIGINHEGNPAKCMEMIESAARAGADSIKLQTLPADENYLPGTESNDIFIINNASILYMTITMTCCQYFLIQ